MIDTVTNYLLVYDSDCGPCTKFKRLVDFLDAYHTIDFVTLIDANERGLLDSIPESNRFNSFHLISPNGEIQSGSEALYDLIGLFPLGHHVSKLIVLLPGGKRMTRFLYYTLSRLRSASSCHLSDNLGHTSDNKESL